MKAARRDLRLNRPRRGASWQAARYSVLPGRADIGSRQYGSEGSFSLIEPGSRGPGFGVSSHPGGHALGGGGDNRDCRMRGRGEPPGRMGAAW